MTVHPNKPILVVDCGGSHVACARFSIIAPGSFVLEKYAVEPLPPAEERSEAEWLGAIGVVLADFSGEGVFAGPCVLVLPGHLSLTRVVQAPGVGPKQRERILGFEARQGFPAEAGDLVWGHEPAGNERADVVLSAVRSAVLEGLCRQANAAGFPPLAAIPGWAALRSAARYNHPDAAGAMLLNIGARSTQLIVSGDRLFFTRTIALGGNAVSLRIAGELGVGFAEAEQLKLRTATGPFSAQVDGPENMALQIATDDFARRLAGEVARSLAGLWGGEAGPPRRVLLSGGGSRLGHLPDLLAKNLGLAVEHHEPLRRVKLAAAAVAPGADPGVAPPAELLGAAVLGPHGGRERRDLLPRNWRRQMALRRRQPLLIAATLLAMAIPWLLIFCLGKKADETRNRLKATEMQLRELRHRESCNREKTRRLEEINRQIAGLQKMEETRTGWVTFLSDLQDRLARVEHAWLEEMKILSPGASHAAGRGPATMGILPAADSNPVAGDSSVRLDLAGSLFDPDNPLSEPGESACRRARALLQSLRVSPFVTAIESERFDAERPGLLGFKVTLVVASQRLF